MLKSDAVAKNILVVIATQAVRMILTFLVRTFFVKILGEVFLGSNSVFTNLLALLNLSELGIGVAIISFIYKPILEDDKETVNALMWMYKKVYIIIGFCVIAIGVVLSFFLPVIISDSIHNDIYIQGLFYVYLIGTAASYFLAYKRNYLIAIEKNYIVALWDSLTELFFSVIQIVILSVGKSYLLYILAQVAKVFVANIFISFYIGKKYKFKVVNPDMRIVDSYKLQIIKFVKDIFISKVGGYIFNSTAAIICSLTLGIIITGKFDNYVFIYTALQSIIVLMFNAIQSTYGYFIHATPDKRKQEKAFIDYEFACFLMGSICMFGVAFLENPLIEIWFGEKYVLDALVPIVMGINILLNMFIQLLSQTFTIYQLYHYDRKIVSISAITNIALSYALSKTAGVVGIVLGTSITSCIYIISRLRVMYKYVFKSAIQTQIINWLQFVVCDVVLGVMLHLILRNIEIVTFMDLVACGTLIIVLVMLCISALFWKSDKFNFIKNKLR